MPDKNLIKGREIVRTWKNDSVGFVELHRPDKANAYNHELLSELESSFRKMEDDKEICTIVITGAGKRCFCAGADLNEMKAKRFADALNLQSAKVFSFIASFSKVTIAAINGAAVAGGLELCLSCDFRICVENAKFSFPETKIGLIPAAGGTQRLPQIVGLAKAKELILGGCVWDANNALNSGLVNAVVPNSELLIRAQAWGKKIGNRDQLALRLAKQAIDQKTSYASISFYEEIAEALLYNLKFNKAETIEDDK